MEIFRGLYNNSSLIVQIVQANVIYLLTTYFYFVIFPPQTFLPLALYIRSIIVRTLFVNYTGIQSLRYVNQRRRERRRQSEQNQGGSQDRNINGTRVSNEVTFDILAERLPQQTSTDPIINQFYNGFSFI